MRAASADSSQSMTAATSSALCTPPSGYCFSAPSRCIGTLSIPAVMGVSVMPGATALTRMPRLAYVAAALRTSASTPPFAAAIAS